VTGVQTCALRSHVHDLDAQVAPRERVAGLRDASEASEDEARDRVIVAAGHITAIETPLQPFDRQMPVDEPGAVGATDRFGTFAAAEVGQLARDCLQNVYWCRDAFDLAVRAGDDREMRARALRLIEELQRGDRYGHVKRRQDVFLRVDVASMDRL